METLRRIRTIRGMNQVDLAEASGVAQNTISEIELGKREARPGTLKKLADALGVEIADLLSGDTEHPLGVAPPSPTQPPLNGFEEERREQHLWVWKGYLTRRVEWCERVLQKSREGSSFLNPFLSLDTAIQWAVYVGIERAQLRTALLPELRSQTDGDSEIVGELHALLERFVAVDDTTNMRVNAMMDEAGLTDEDKKQRLRLIDGSAA